MHQGSMSGSTTTPAVVDQGNTTVVKTRIKFSDSQKALLEASFLRNAYPSADERKQLAVTLQVDPKVVDNWSVRARNHRSLIYLDLAGQVPQLPQSYPW